MVFAKKNSFNYNYKYYNVFNVCSLSNNYCCVFYRKLNIYLLNILTSKLPNITNKIQTFTQKCLLFLSFKIR